LHGNNASDVIIVYMSADAQTNKQTSRHGKPKATLGPTGHA